MPDELNREPIQTWSTYYCPITTTFSRPLSAKMRPIVRTPSHVSPQGSHELYKRAPWVSPFCNRTPPYTDIITLDFCELSPMPSQGTALPERRHRRPVNSGLCKLEGQWYPVIKEKPTVAVTLPPVTKTQRSDPIPIPALKNPPPTRPRRKSQFSYMSPPPKSTSNKSTSPPSELLFSISMPSESPPINEGKKGSSLSPPPLIKGDKSSGQRGRKLERPP